MKNKGYILCGPARAGKTTLAKLVARHGPDTLSLLFEGLFPAYLSRFSYHCPSRHSLLLREYLNRPRYTDKEKGEKLSPARQLAVTEIPAAPANNFLEAIFCFFDEAATGQEKKHWVIADLNAEFYYRKLLAGANNTDLVMIMRDPRECICAGLYWRFYPDSIKPRTGWFYKKLFNWLLSAEMARRIKTEKPSRFHLINFNGLRTDKDVQESVAALLGLQGNWRDELETPLHYTLAEEGRFLAPDGRSHLLFSQKELSIIQYLAAPYMDGLGYERLTLREKPFLPLLWLLKGFFNFLKIVAFFSPPAALRFTMLVFSPLQYMKWQGERVKQFIRDLRTSGQDVKFKG